MEYKLHHHKTEKRYVVIDKNKKSTSFSEKVYGKYTKNMAEYFMKTGIRLNNWRIEHDTYYELIHYIYKTDEYKSILISKESYDLIKDYKLHLSYGYVIISIPINKTKSKNIRLHRFILNVENNSDIIIDHINHNPLDNRLENLRKLKDLSSNSRNRNRETLTNASKVTGVSLTGKEENKFWQVSWYDKDTKKRKFKSFSIKKHGYEKALELAIEFRNKMVEEHYESYINENTINN